jgi:hypothetical protein
MSLQSNILSKIQECSYISVINCITFFHQWRIIIFDKHKLIVVIHREIEQWNVNVMRYKNIDAYVQREMNNILREYSWVKMYIDDVIVFNKTLKEHLNHLTQLFALFQHLNITLKAKKTYLRYSSIFLLRQKIDSLNLIIAEDKLKIIVNLSFSRILKNLKRYLEVIEWLRDYVTYYAQKIESLQKRETNLLKKSFCEFISIRDIKRRFQWTTSMFKFSAIAELNFEHVEQFDSIQFSNWTRIFVQLSSLNKIFCSNSRNLYVTNSISSNSSCSIQELSLNFCSKFNFTIRLFRLNDELKIELIAS